MANEQLTIQPNDARMTVIGKSWPDQATDSGGGDWDNTYNGTYSGPIPRTDLPVRIAVTEPPTKTEYKDSEMIDLAGIVVTAYNADGTVWTSSDYPDGTIPTDELVPETNKVIARDGSAPDFFEYYGYRFIVNPPNTVSTIIEPWGTDKTRYVSYFINCPEVSFSDYGDLYEIVSTDRVTYIPSGIYVGEHLLRAARTPVVDEAFIRIITSGEMPPYKYGSRGFGYSYTRDDKTVYYSWGPTHEGYGQGDDGRYYNIRPQLGLIGSPGVHARPYRTGGGMPAWMPEVAWRMVYGAMSGKYENIIISWKRPEDGQELKAFIQVYARNSVSTISTGGN